MERIERHASGAREGRHPYMVSILAAMLVCTSVVAPSDAEDRDDGQVIASCRGAAKSAPAAKSRVIDVLIAAKPPASLWPRYRAAALRAVSIGCSLPGTKLVIRAVSSNAILEAPRFSRVSPSSADSPNPLLGLGARESFARSAIAAVDSFGSDPPSGRQESDDIVSALYLAGRDGSDGGTQVILVLHNSWPRGMYRYHSDIASHIDEAIATARGNGNMPMFGSKSSVFLGGLAPGEMQGLNPLEVLRLCKFYSGFLGAGGAKLANCPIEPSDNDLTDSLQ